jgi:hypothetical protein
MSPCVADILPPIQGSRCLLHRSKKSISFKIHQTLLVSADNTLLRTAGFRENGKAYRQKGAMFLKIRLNGWTQGWPVSCTKNESFTRLHPQQVAGTRCLECQPLQQILPALLRTQVEATIRSAGSPSVWRVSTGNYLFGSKNPQTKLSTAYARPCWNSVS